jgi:hypothetical protein
MLADTPLGRPTTQELSACGLKLGATLRVDGAHFSQGWGDCIGWITKIHNIFGYCTPSFFRTSKKTATNFVMIGIATLSRRKAKILHQEYVVDIISWHVEGEPYV